MFHIMKSAQKSELDRFCRCMELTYYLVANRILGVPSGVYRFESNRAVLVRVAPAATDGQISRLFVQPEFAQAPMLVVVTGNMEAVCGHYGARGHRMLLQRAGASCNKLWMACATTGISSCIVAGIVPAAVRRACRLEASRSSGLIALAAGHRPDQSVSTASPRVIERGLG